MKKTIFMLLSLGLFACNQQTDSVDKLRVRIDDLESQLADTYKPGFGEFMSSIQAHHSKLWFAGKNKNWKLADFEIHEIMENIEGVKKYQMERKESQMIEMINPALDSVTLAIKTKNSILFKNSYELLTNTCNSCHRDTNFEFNIVKIPSAPLFNNQDFKSEQ